MGPLYASGIIVVENDGAFGEKGQNIEIAEDVTDALQTFGAVIHGSYFGFCRASSSVGLTLGLPVDGTSETYEESSDGASFEKLKFHFKILKQNLGQNIKKMDLKL